MKYNPIMKKYQNQYHVIFTTLFFLVAAVLLMQSQGTDALTIFRGSNNRQQSKAQVQMQQN